MNHFFKFYWDEYGERSYLWGDPINWYDPAPSGMVLVIGVPEGLTADKVVARLHRGTVCRSVVEWDRLEKIKGPFIFTGGRLTTAEAAAFLGITRRAIQLALKEGRLPGTKTGRDWTLCREDLELLVKHGLIRRKIPA